MNLHTGQVSCDRCRPQVIEAGDRGSHQHDLALEALGFGASSDDFRCRHEAPRIVQTIADVKDATAIGRNPVAGDVDGGDAVRDAPLALDLDSVVLLKSGN